MKILISTPCYEYGIHSQMAQSLIRAIEYERKKNVSINWDTPSSSMIAHSRNSSANEVLIDNFDWLLFWDSDIEVEQSEFITGMIQTAYKTDAGIVGLACPLKAFPPVYNYAVRTEAGYTNVHILPKEPTEVDVIGTGVMLIKASVLAKITAPWFTITDTFHEKPGFFPEDWNFCERAQKAGFKVIVDPRYSVYHWGEHKYGV